MAHFVSSSFIYHMMRCTLFKSCVCGGTNLLPEKCFSDFVLLVFSCLYPSVHIHSLLLKATCLQSPTLFISRGFFFPLLDGLMGNGKRHGNDVIGSAKMGMDLGEDVEGPAPLENALMIEAAQQSSQERCVPGFLNTFSNKKTFL